MPTGAVPPQRPSKRGQPKMSRRGFLRDAYGGQSAEQAIESIAIRLTGFGELIDAADLVSERIGDAETCGRADYRAAGIRHCHFDEPHARGDITDSADRLGHDHNPSRSRRAPLCPSMPVR